MYRLKVQLKIYYLKILDDDDLETMKETCLYDKQFATKRSLITNAVNLAYHYTINTTLFTSGNGFLFNKNEQSHGSRKEIYYCMYITKDETQLLPKENIKLNKQILKSVLNCRSQKQISRCKLNA
jgi:hypothetical protein